MILPRTRQTSTNGYSSKAHDSIAAIVKVIRDGKRFLVCSHSRPDGDAVGSVLAMGMNWASGLTWSRRIGFRWCIGAFREPIACARRCEFMGRTMRHSAGM